MQRDWRSFWILQYRSPLGFLDIEGDPKELLRSLGLYAYKSNGSRRILTERAEFKILKALLKLGHANVYEISRSSKNIGHYSTILRALRRMEKKNLVRVVLEGKTGRRKKVYQVTVLGEIIGPLAKDGWKRAAERIATRSSRFQDCQKAHQSFDPYYYWYQTKDIIENLIHPSTNKGLQSDLEEVVVKCEFRWIKTFVIEKLSARDNRSENLHILQKLSNIDWIRPVIIQYIADYVGEEKEWLKIIDDFKRKLVS